jgi:hypothetical protein
MRRLFLFRVDIERTEYVVAASEDDALEAISHADIDIDAYEDGYARPCSESDTIGPEYGLAYLGGLTPAEAAIFEDMPTKDIKEKIEALIKDGVMAPNTGGSLVLGGVEVDGDGEDDDDDDDLEDLTDDSSDD